MISRLRVLFFIIFAVSSFFCTAAEDCAKLLIYNGSNTSPYTTAMDSNLTTFGCDLNQNISIIVHGWNAGTNFTWVDKLATKLVQVRGGCSVLYKYQACVNDKDYVITLTLWHAMSQKLTTLLRRLEDEGYNPGDMFIYGFSIGSRIAIDAAISFGDQKIGNVDVCEMANVGFDWIYFRDSKRAAKNVQCIFTTNFASSVFRNQCHQNWLMGDCGKRQPAALDAEYLLCVLTGCGHYVLGSHNLCNIYYYNAFEHDYLADNTKSCSGVSYPENIPGNFKMGFMESRRSSQIQGTFASPTSSVWPYN